MDKYSWKAFKGEATKTCHQWLDDSVLHHIGKNWYIKRKQSKFFTFRWSLKLWPHLYLCFLQKKCMILNILFKYKYYTSIGLLIGKHTFVFTLSIYWDLMGVMRILSKYVIFKNLKYGKLFCKVCLECC